MTTKTYRITLFDGNNYISEQTVLLAAKSNGLPNENKISLEELLANIKIDSVSRPYSHKNMSAYITNNTLLITDSSDEKDVKVICKIEEVELFDVMAD